MDKTENSLSRLVHPSDDSSTEISLVKKSLQALGFSETDQAWLVEVFKRSDCFGDQTGEHVFRHEFGTPDVAEGLDALKKQIRIETDSRNALVLLFSTMLNFGPGYNAYLLPNVQREESNTSVEGTQWIKEFQRHAKFSTEGLNLQKLREGSKNATFRFDELLPFLFPKRIPLVQTVDLELLNPVRRQSLSNNDFKNLNELEYWLIWRFKANAERCEKVRLDTLLPVFSTFSDEVLGNKILGFLNAIHYGMTIGSWESVSGERLDALNDGWQVVARELIPFLELLNDRNPKLKQERSPLLKAWWHLSQCIYSWSMGRLEAELSEDLRNRLVESASRHIGILRSVLRDTPEVFAGEDAPGVPTSDFYDKAYYVLLCFATPSWKCLKPLLLAFTEMTEQAVARDLRTWSEHNSTDNPPSIYSRVANWIEVAMYPQNLQTELEKDPYLQGLREEFAKFCLGRLRTRGKNKDSRYTHTDFVEPRPVWRGCYIQALKVLRVNPGGRAHRTLFWMSHHDPDAGVREYARRAHSQVRHLDGKKSNLDEGASPRRPLFEAFWWLRQAHLLTLGVEVDQAGAMRTRRTELHRTREKEDRYKRKR